MVLSSALLSDMRARATSATPDPNWTALKEAADSYLGQSFGFKLTINSATPGNPTTFTTVEPVASMGSDPIMIGGLTGNWVAANNRLVWDRTTGTLSSIAVANGTATVTVVGPHRFNGGDYVAVFGATEPALNNQFPVKSTGPSTFTFTTTAPDGTHTEATLRLYGYLYGEAGSQWTPTVTGTNTFQIPLDSTGFGPLAGSPVTFFRNACTRTGQMCYSYEGDSWDEVVTELALAYQVSGNTAYGDKAIEWLDYINALGNNGLIQPVLIDSGYPARYIPRDIGLVYDWIYDRLSPSQRAATATAAANWWLPYASAAYEDPHPAIAGYARYTSFLGASDCPSGKLCPSPTYRYADRGGAGNYWTGYLGYALFGYALYGDWTGAADVVTRMNAELNDQYYAAFYNASPYEGFRAGGTIWGSTQYNQTSDARMAFAMAARKTATGRDMIADRDWYRRTWDAFLYLIMPNQWRLIAEGRFNNNWGAPIHRTLEETSLVAAALLEGTTEGGTAEYVYLNYPKVLAGNTASAPIWEKFMFDRPGRSTVNPATLSSTAYNGDWVTWRGDSDGSGPWSTAAHYLALNGEKKQPGDHGTYFAGDMAIVKGSDMLLVQPCQWYGSSQDEFDGAWEEGYVRLAGTKITVDTNHVATVASSSLPTIKHRIVVMNSATSVLNDDFHVVTGLGSGTFAFPTNAPAGTYTGDVSWNGTIECEALWDATLANTFGIDTQGEGPNSANNGEQGPYAASQLAQVFAQGDSWMWVRHDFTENYDADPNSRKPATRPVQYFFRNVLAAGDGVYFVFDRINAAQRLNNGGWTGALYWHFSPSWEKTLVDGNVASARAGASRIWLNALFPVSGGTAVMTYSRDCMPTAAGKPVVCSPSMPDPQTQRVAVFDSAQGRDLDALAVFNVTAAGGTNPPTSVLATIDGTHVGAQVGGAQPKVAVFSKEIILTAEYPGYAVQPQMGSAFKHTASAANCWVTDLVAGTYTVTKDGGRMPSIVVGTDGVAYIKACAAGAWVLTKQ
jgi:hypothetical protein